MGVTSRRILTVMVAVVAVAVMLAVPLITAVDTDADSEGIKAGYSVKLENATPDQVTTATGGMTKAMLLNSAIGLGMMIFNPTAFGVPTADDGPLTASIAAGQEISADKTRDRSFGSATISCDDGTVTFTAMVDDSLISPDIDSCPQSFQDAAEAIAAYLGANVHDEDTVAITGSFNSKHANEDVYEYTILEGNKCVLKKSVETDYLADDVDVTITLTHGAESKSIRFVSNIHGLYSSEWNYTYDATPVVPGTQFTAKNTIGSYYSGEMFFEVNEQKYNLSQSVSLDRTGTADIVDQASIIIESDLETTISLIPDTAAAATIDKTYDAASSAFDDVVMSAVGDDILKLILIIVGIVIGVLVLIVILIVVLIVLSKKKKKQQM